MKTFLFGAISSGALMIASAAMAAPPLPTSFTPAVTQSSANDSSSIDQVGDNNTATANQQDPTGRNDQIVVIQGLPGTGTAHDNTATATQTGSGQQALIVQANVAATDGLTYGPNGGTLGNTATVTQSGANNHAFSYQFGYDNTSSITQAATNGGSAASGFLQGVSGAANYGNAESAAVGLRHTTLSTIDSDLAAGYPALNSQNQANIVQDWAHGNGASILQQEPDNHANIVQAFQTNSAASITQDNTYGTGQNKAWILQEGVAGTGNNDYASISQNGLELASIEQLDATNSYSKVVQRDGTVHELAVSYQTGNNEYSTITQFGTSSNDVARVYQAGGNDVSDVSQTGIGNNTANVNQGLANAWSHVSQNGLGNTANVNQYATAIVRLNPGH